MPLVISIPAGTPTMTPSAADARFSMVIIHLTSLCSTPRARNEAISERLSKALVAMVL